MTEQPGIYWTSKKQKYGDSPMTDTGESPQREESNHYSIHYVNYTRLPGMAVNHPASTSSFCTVTNRKFLAMGCTVFCNLPFGSFASKNSDPKPNTLPQEGQVVKILPHRPKKQGAATRLDETAAQ